ncbi:MAG: 3-hydroxybutyrate dehydrogenase, partial [Anaerolineae bacterium]|nr:3-hydroxybutyrate dehydrogenase [Anaerolineae bacterium]
TGVLTGKGQKWGGSLIRPEATGYGAVYFTLEMLATRKTELAGKRALVTGGSKGIGRSIALTLAGAGADVVVSARHQPNLEAVATEIESLGRRALAATCDVADKAQIQALADQVLDTFGGIDILVNNAGIARSHKFLNHPDEMWDQTLAVNLTGVYLMTKAFTPAMVAQKWGRVINIASIASKVGGKYIAAYSASKHGVLGLTRSLALEFVADNITVNAICPGYVNTPMTKANIANIAKQTGAPEAKIRTSLENQSPQQRFVEPEEVAAVALLLAQDSGQGITGQAINIDGGSVMF